MVSNPQKRQSRPAPGAARVFKPLAGSVFCAGAAIAASALAAGHPWEVWVPLGFSAVPLMIALLFGARAGIVGTLLAAGAFAFFLFSPVGSIHVASRAARANLGWLLLIGITSSLLFAPTPGGLRGAEHRGETTEPDSPAS